MGSLEKSMQTPPPRAAQDSWVTASPQGSGAQSRRGPTSLPTCQMAPEKDPEASEFRKLCSFWFLRPRNPAIGGLGHHHHHLPLRQGGLAGPHVPSPCRPAASVHTVCTRPRKSSLKPQNHRLLRWHHGNTTATSLREPAGVGPAGSGQGGQRRSLPWAGPPGGSSSTRKGHHPAVRSQARGVGGCVPKSTPLILRSQEVSLPLRWPHGWWLKQWLRNA